MLEGYEQIKKHNRLSQRKGGNVFIEAHSGADREGCWRLTAIVFAIGQAKWVHDELPGRRCWMRLRNCTAMREVAVIHTTDCPPLNNHGERELMHTQQGLNDGSSL